VTRATAVLLAFGPSLLGGVVGAVWWMASPPSLTPRLGLLSALAAGAATGGLLLAAAAWLERHLRSFAWVSRTTEQALARLGLPAPLAAVLAVGTSLGEELLFRGMLLDRFGLVAQALAFGALHPAGRRGWSYPVFVTAAGLALGGLVLVTGRISSAMAAHVVVNGVGLLARRGRLRPPIRPRSDRSEPPPP
jgi:membrane protease YdiL (CAAX protease family)